MLERRAADVQANPRNVPNGPSRSQAFGAQLRSSTTVWNNQERNVVEGYASVVEKRYRMYDLFGEYDEIVDARAFDETLSKNPDVAYLVNHRGVTMARTTNGSLELKADGKGLHTLAYLNPKRTDVSDLIHAIEDRDVTEMSFAFRIDDGEWSEDYSEFRILRVDLDRGDVSAVNYGASPHTSVAARQGEILSDLRHLPAGARRAALDLLSDEDDDTSAPASEAREQAPVEEPKQTASLDELRAFLNDEPKGRSVAMVQRELDLL